ncbi:MAG TPA: peptidase S10 [Gammaproteobacteria bacterium]
MKLRHILPALLLASTLPAWADDAPAKDAAKPSTDYTKPTLSTTSGSVTIHGDKISYKANTGTLVLKDDKDEPGVSMFYVYYAKDGAPSNRPVTFFFNGGPGSATVWLHMGAFGPERVRTADDTHTPGAPYALVNNDDSLLDVTDEVFIDAPGTGFSRVIDKDLGGKADPKDYYGVDQDGKAFTAFIQQFLSKYDRWNSPKYIFGESYGTIRGPVLTLDLENASVDINGLIMLSAIPNTDISADGDSLNPAIDIPFALVLPTQAAVAWYHDKIPNKPAKLEDFLAQVEKFAMGDYLTALNAGAMLDQATKQKIAQQLSAYTGLSADYWMKANLRVNGGQFEHELFRDSDKLAGRLDGRFSGYALDPLGEQAEYDPQSSSISSAYVSLFNEYVRKTLNYGADQSYIPLSFDVNGKWDYKHANPFGQGFPGATNVLPDLAIAMGQNPTMKVMLAGGYYDLATAFYGAQFQMQHLPMDDKLQANISYAFYPSGHMVYANEASAKKLHDDVAKFIENSHK